MIERTSIVGGVLVGMISTTCLAEELVSVPTLQGHPPLYVYRDTIKRDGPAVSFTYLLETPTGSNAIDATIDCAARTWASQGTRIYPDGGEKRVGRPVKDEPPEAIKPKSTWDFLAKAVCT